MKAEPRNGGRTQRGLGAWELKMLSTQQSRGKLGIYLSIYLSIIYGWMASLIQWTWTWANSRWWCGAGRPGMLQSMGSQESDMTWWLNNNIYLSAYLPTYLPYLLRNKEERNGICTRSHPQQEKKKCVKKKKEKRKGKARVKRKRKEKDIWKC